MSSRKDSRGNPAQQAFEDAIAFLRSHPLFAPLARHSRMYRTHDQSFPGEYWSRVSSRGAIVANGRRHASADEWIYVLAHDLLHLGFGHFDQAANDPAWNAACCCTVNHFLSQLKVGRPQLGHLVPAQYAGRDEQSLYQEFKLLGIPAALVGAGTAGDHACDILMEAEVRSLWAQQSSWQDLFAHGLREAVTSAVDVAGGKRASLTDGRAVLSEAELARRWFISSYPLLGALAAHFKIVEDRFICMRLDIQIAAVDDVAGEIYINPLAGLAGDELRFVIAHEILHPALRHSARRAGRDSYLWNVACDYVINHWLVEMRIGTMPDGCLYDTSLKGMSAEAIYELMVTDMRRFRKLATLRGEGLGDILGDRSTDYWTSGPGMDLDLFYRSALGQGLSYHQSVGRGMLPAGLVEEIYALSQPPIPWDVGLGRWFDERFPPLERRRSYGKASRRQSSTPDIARPGWTAPFDPEGQRTFGIILDSSGSMDRHLLGQALGAIASYAVARDVSLVRLVYCDAQPYDGGYIEPEQLGGCQPVHVKGRGGTVLQPGVDFLDARADFPADAPVLIITDGWSERLTVRRDHAFLLPVGRYHDLPFKPMGPVFRIDH